MKKLPATLQRKIKKIEDIVHWSYDVGTAEGYLDCSFEDEWMDRSAQVGSIIYTDLRRDLDDYLWLLRLQPTYYLDHYERLQIFTDEYSVIESKLEKILRRFEKKKDKALNE